MYSKWKEATKTMGRCTMVHHPHRHPRWLLEQMEAGPWEEWVSDAINENSLRNHHMSNHNKQASKQHSTT